jgi:hypothetical protein
MSRLIIGGIIVFVIGIISVVLYSVFNKSSNTTTNNANNNVQVAEPGSLQWCKQEFSKYKFVQDKPYDIIGIAQGRCDNDNYPDELEKVIISNNPSWKGSLFIGSKQNKCLSKLQPILDGFRSSGTLGDVLTIEIRECNDYKNKVRTSMLGVNPGYLGSIEIK